MNKICMLFENAGGTTDKCRGSTVQKPSVKSGSIIYHQHKQQSVWFLDTFHKFLDAQGNRSANWADTETQRQSESHKEWDGEM